MISAQSLAAGIGTRDGSGSGDHDQPYLFGRRPRALAPYPFSTRRQFARLLVLRSRVQESYLAPTASPPGRMMLRPTAPRGKPGSDEQRAAGCASAILSGL